MYPCTTLIFTCAYRLSAWRLPQRSHHAPRGRVNNGMVPPEGLRFHIRESVQKGHAERIGHGVSVMYEDKPIELMQDLAKKNVLVEICLTSNDLILGVKWTEASASDLSQIWRARRAGHRRSGRIAGGHDAGICAGRDAIRSPTQILRGWRAKASRTVFFPARVSGLTQKHFAETGLARSTIQRAIARPRLVKRFSRAMNERMSNGNWRGHSHSLRQRRSKNLSSLPPHLRFNR